jgi:hypothetical protein
MHAPEITKFHLEDWKQLEVIVCCVDQLMSSSSILPCNLNPLLKLTPQHFSNPSPALSLGSLTRFISLTPSPMTRSRAIDRGNRCEGILSLILKVECGLWCAKTFAYLSYSWANIFFPPPTTHQCLFLTHHCQLHTYSHQPTSF